MSREDAGAQRFRVEACGPLVVETPVQVTLVYAAGKAGFRAGGNLWIFYDIRQLGPTSGARQNYDRPDGIVVRGPEGTRWSASALAQGGVVRTLDLYPAVHEFLHGIHVRCEGGTLAPGDLVHISLKNHPDGFLLPRNSIDDFYFGAVEDPTGGLGLEPTGDGKYHVFQPRDADVRVMRSNGLCVLPGLPAAVRATCPSLAAAGEDGGAVTRVAVNMEDAFGNPVPAARWWVAASSIRQASLAAPATQAATATEVVSGAGTELDVAVGGSHDAVVVTVEAGGRTLTARSNAVRIVAPHDAQPLGLYWGDLHGMMFNHRPFEDYFLWARDVTRLDFAGGQLFSYLSCVRETWERYLEVWQDFDRPGRFVSLPSVECGTPPDGSHRHYFLPDPAEAPPMFCEDRPAAHDPKHLARLYPGTVICGDYRDLYRETQARGGFLHGHFHTKFYEGETLAEICQKQVLDPAVEEAKINRALLSGARLGIVGGSDTHDSRPGNPHTERHADWKPAGLTAVWAEGLDRRSLFDAFKSRRCYATTGPRIVMDFRVNDAWMGAEARATASGYEFQADVLGTANLRSLELLVNGEVAQTYTPRGERVTLCGNVPLPIQSASEGPAAVPPYCYLRVTQADGNRAWSSPIWLS